MPGTAEDRRAGCQCEACVMRRLIELLQGQVRALAAERDEARSALARATDRVRRAVEYANRAAVSLGSGDLGDVELLLGLLVAPSGPAAEALRRAGLKIDRARAELREAQTA